MGKRPEDLPLNDAPHKLPTGPDVREADWYQFCRELDDMIQYGDFAWAEDTISGIRDSVERYHTVTSGQRRAIENIRNARRRADGFRRRYEGFRRY